MKKIQIPDRLILIKVSVSLLCSKINSHFQKFDRNRIIHLVVQKVDIDYVRLVLVLIKKVVGFLSLVELKIYCSYKILLFYYEISGGVVAVPLLFEYKFKYFNFSLQINRLGIHCKVIYSYLNIILK
ncbi:hypothetical protein DW083_18765 [Parabacteroides sp. AF48-14]|nr:hypothetical protein DW083_18765 [Parabacteroides sp. AF48-14]